MNALDGFENVHTPSTSSVSIPEGGFPFASKSAKSSVLIIPSPSTSAVAAVFTNPSPSKSSSE